MQWEKNSRKGKQRNKCRKNIIGLKKLKIKIIKKWKKKRGRRKKKGKKKENSSELQKPYVEAGVYNNNRKCDWIDIYIYTHEHTEEIIYRATVEKQT